MTDVLVDTNILVYGNDPSDQVKQRQSLSTLETLMRARAAVLSVQCLNEFYRTVRWGIPKPMDHAEALAAADGFARNCLVLPLTATAALDGMRACDQYSMSFWDALIWAVAKEAEVPVILSEDFTDGQAIEGVRFVDPFIASFDIDTLMG